ncbi:hypothetical protein DSOUD_3182 [Desulfuromonas soudanensis]|uniref:C4-type zinc ribbon domain-containing protein n=1 Tax=Desulfuromonas soudanensis TaxID=1603606 RepID=A0A0M5IRY1_9BACT|nr:C4-type zinc ribbon domain-containing protein [Desulfuromonas soudanensis]ALC17906.1 hypothetical protein DSOUD_3182 [Desulfuromonas soudanensis]
MQEQMQVLKELQQLDQDLKGIRQNRQKLDQEQAVLGADLDRVRAMVDALSTSIDLLKQQRQEISLALVQEKDNVAKAEGRLPSIKTQKEYVAVLKEIDTAKKLNKDLNEKIQAKDGEIAALARELEEKETEMAAIEEKVNARRSELEKALSGFDLSLAKKDGARNELLGKLPVPLRKRYQLLLDRRDGVAVVEASNETCLGCNMHLPPQLFNSLFQFKEVQSCPHCNRLLFVNGEC